LDTVKKIGLFSSWCPKLVTGLCETLTNGVRVWQRHIVEKH